MARAMRRLAGVAALAASSSVLLASPTLGDKEAPQVYLVSKPFTTVKGSNVSGRFEIVTKMDSGVLTVQYMKWDLGGVPRECRRGIRDPKLCRIYLAKRKKGNPCQPWYDWETPVPLYNYSHISPDPWYSTKYTTAMVGSWRPIDDKANAGELSAATPRRLGMLSSMRSMLGWSHRRIRLDDGSVKIEAGIRSRGAMNVTTGMNWKDVAKSSVVLHDESGALIACAEFTEVSGCYPEDEWRQQGVFEFGMAFEECGTNIYCTKGHPDCRHACTVDEDCEHHPLRVCDGVEYRCTHKGVFEGGTWGVLVDVAAGLIFAFTSGLSISVGVGSGGLFVPLLTLMLRFNLREATALSQACLAGGSSTALLYNLRLRHPSGRKPMIDYDLVLVMAPTLLVGSIIGSTLHMVMPSWSIMAVLDLVLFYSCGKTFQKAVVTRRREAAAAGPQGSLAAVSPRAYEQFHESVTEAQPVQGDAREVCVEMQKRSGGTAGTEVFNGVGKTKTWPQFPAVEILLFLFMWAAAIASAFCRGGPKDRGVVDFASVGYWAIIGGTTLLLVGVAALGAGRAARRPLLGPSSNLPASRDLVFTAGASANIIVASLAAGLVAALCGIGGGLIMGPVLLGLGAPPQVQSASTGTALFVMSTTLALTYIVQGEVHPAYAVYFAAATGAGAILGRPILSWLIHKSMRPSVMVFLLAFVILALVSVMTAFCVMQVLEDVIVGQEVGFKSLNR